MNTIKRMTTAAAASALTAGAIAATLLGTGDASAHIDSGSYSMTVHGFAGTVDHSSAVVRGDTAVVNGQPYRLIQTPGGGYAELSGIPGYSRITLAHKGAGYTGHMWMLGAQVGTVDLDRR